MYVCFCMSQYHRHMRPGFFETQTIKALGPVVVENAQLVLNQFKNFLT